MFLSTKLTKMRLLVHEVRQSSSLRTLRILSTYRVKMDSKDQLDQLASKEIR